jgi:hypothetical protein
MEAFEMTDAKPAEPKKSGRKPKVVSEETPKKMRINCDVPELIVDALDEAAAYIWKDRTGALRVGVLLLTMIMDHTKKGHELGYLNDKGEFVPVIFADFYLQLNRSKEALEKKV